MPTVMKKLLLLRNLLQAMVMFRRMLLPMATPMQMATIKSRASVLLPPRGPGGVIRLPVGAVAGLVRAKTVKTVATPTLILTPKRFQPDLSI
jgi:hypothetical protein